MTRRKLDLGQFQFGFPDEDIKTSLHDEIVLWLKKNAKPIMERIVAWEASWNEDILKKKKAQMVEMVERRKSSLRESISKGEARISRGGALSTFLQKAPQEVEAGKRELASLEAWTGPIEPQPPQFDVISELERPIQRERYKTTDIVGYADVVMVASGTTFSPSHPPYSNGEPVLGIDAATYLKWNVGFRELGYAAFDAKSTIPSLGELIRQFKTYKVYWKKWPFYAVCPDGRFAEEISDEGFGFIKYPEGAITPPKEKSWS